MARPGRSSKRDDRSRTREDQDPRNRSRSRGRGSGASSGPSRRATYRWASGPSEAEMDELERQLEDLCVNTSFHTAAGDREYENGDFLRAREHFESAVKACKEKLEFANSIGEPERVLRGYAEDLAEAEDLVDKACMRHLQKQYERDLAAAVQLAKRPLEECKTRKAIAAFTCAENQLVELERLLPGTVARDYPGAMRRLDDTIRELTLLDAGLRAIRDMTLHLRDADAAITSGDAITARMAFNSGRRALEEGYNTMPPKYRPSPEYIGKFRAQVGTLQTRGDQRFGFRMW